ncbi:5-bromo-4-chloroindolyl phosphate hydrolysis family protein [Clostridium sp. SM-530-WT-3G]|uniref:5-bromo-4-chloroindolyl phosphate hydrolysis family protein n=1 Tax=Clostridium sp. SM-530-WT-3G TaxID=2725303 RepID=UPI00145CF129|nr:5-bromo-4-chloroindolyl phosphate hydrolysis family protein [Clostridium sp. SM-530-WT-3G]NME84359.1 5-bromo-4-chloroindolyl phosphate hydrolysis protein [Clostridium sp. SM-530-WT-3G]
MGKNDFSDIEDQIKDTVQNALNYIDFSGIRDSFNTTTENTINEVKNQVKDASNYIGKKVKDYSSSEYVKKMFKSKNINEMEKYIAKKPKGRYTGKIYNYVGAFGSIGFGISTLVLSIIAIFGIGSNVLRSGIIIPLSIVAAFFAASVYLTYKGVNIRKRIERFKKYSDCLIEKKYCTIDKLASSVNKKNKFVLKDLEKMMELNMFREGHIDEDKKYFILSDKIYDEYLISLESYKNRVKEEELNSNNNSEKSDAELVADIGRKYIAEIRNANEVIVSPEMSDKLYKLENIVKEIFNTIEKNPNKLPEVKKFIDHYLPITLKLVNSYKELAMQSIETENIKKAKEEIEKSIDLINTAFENLFDDLFEDAAMDISSDISVLETLFNQDGLTNNDFKNKK